MFQFFICQKSDPSLPTPFTQLAGLSFLSHFFSPKTKKKRLASELFTYLEAVLLARPNFCRNSIVLLRLPKFNFTRLTCTNCGRLASNQTTQQFNSSFSRLFSSRSFNTDRLFSLIQKANQINEHYPESQMLPNTNSENSATKIGYFDLQHTNPFHDTPSWLLPHKTDRFRGVLIEKEAIGSTLIKYQEILPDATSSSPNFLNHFRSLLLNSLIFWHSTSHSGVWLTIFKENSHLIPTAIELGFTFHHAKTDRVVMILWLPSWPIENYEFVPTDQKVERSYSPARLQCMIPPYPHTSLGVGSFVINSKLEALTICEKYAVLKQFWKLSGGTVDLNEDLDECAIREVFEETGVKCKFVSILGWRHILNYRWGTGDMYFIALCIPIDENQKLNPQAAEIGDCKWISLREFMRLPSVKWMGSTVYKPLYAELKRMYPQHFDDLMKDESELKLFYEEQQNEPQIQEKSSSISPSNQSDTVAQIVLSSNDSLNFSPCNIIPKIIQNPVRNSESKFYVVNHQMNENDYENNSHQTNNFNNVSKQSKM